MASKPIFMGTTKATLPWEEVATVTKTLVIDSRQRDCTKYKNPSFYQIEFGDIFKNITSVELKGAIVPKSVYNVHSGNNKIDFSIGDYVSSFQILGSGAGYTSAPSVTISSPPGAGTTATAQAIINTSGSITNLIITNAGSGYNPTNPPFVFVTPPNNLKEAVYPRIISKIGILYTATLRPGEYEIGGNPNPPGQTLPTKLLLEIQNAMNWAVNGGSYDPASTSPFAVCVVSQYPELTAIPGTPQAADTNACQFNRIQVVNTQFSIWQFLWCTGPNDIISSASILGFNTVDSPIGIPTAAVVAPGGTLIPAGTTIRGYFDYNLQNDPEYVILGISTGNLILDRITSLDDGIDHKFAILVFDNNIPDTLKDLSAAPTGTVVNINGIQYLEGPTGKGTFWRPPGITKPVKGSDYDGPKKLSFKPAQGKLSSMTIAFTKFGYKPGTAMLPYNMEGREHTLLFELTATDNRSQKE